MTTEQDVPPEYRADRDEDARIAAYAKRLRDEIGAAELAIGKAQQTRLELGRMHYEMSDDSVGRSVADLLISARRSLLDAALVAGEFLRPIEDAEKDAEVERLRAEVDQLQRRLADRDRLPVPASHYCDSGNCGVCGDGTGDAAASASARAILAEDSARYHGFVAALDGTFRFCGLAPGHEDWCVDSDGHVIVTAAKPADAVNPVDGEGSDSD